MTASGTLEDNQEFVTFTVPTLDELGEEIADSVRMAVYCSNNAFKVVTED